MRKSINVGLIGSKFMGRAQSHGLRNLHMFAADLSVEPALKTICGRDQAGLNRMSEQFGWRTCATDWRLVVEDPQIEIIVVGTPASLHSPIAIAAAESGKHILSDKPLALTASEAALMLATAESASIKHMVNFNYRRVPAVYSALQGFRRVLVTVSTHPYVSRWWPPGHAIGWEHTFTHQYYELFRAIRDGTPASPSFADGLKCHEVIDAVACADQSRSWVHA